MIKIFCDVCSKELTAPEIAYCNEMIGKHLCRQHIKEPSNTVWTKVIVACPLCGGFHKYATTGCPNGLR